VWRAKEAESVRFQFALKYWQIIIKNLRNAGWNCGSMTPTDGKGRPIWVVAAEREDAGRFIVHADQLARRASWQSPHSFAAKLDSGA
jgi:hypothetical protein